MESQKKQLEGEIYPKCKCSHDKIRHHLIEGKRTWCLDCECIEFTLRGKK